MCVCVIVIVIIMIITLVILMYIYIYIVSFHSEVLDSPLAERHGGSRWDYQPSRRIQCKMKTCSSEAT